MQETVREQSLTQQSAERAQKAHISEKTFFKRMTASILSIITCMFAMGLGAYAHFTNTTETSRAQIRSAEYDLDWSITVNGEKTQNGRIVCPDTDGLPKEYEITISPGPDNTATTGFCVIDIYDYQDGYVTRDNATPRLTLHTAQIGKDIAAPGGERTTLTFTVKVSSPAIITFTPNWGTSGNYRYDNANNELYIEEGERIEIDLVTTTEKGTTQSSSTDQ